MYSGAGRVNNHSFADNRVHRIPKYTEYKSYSFAPRSAKAYLAATSLGDTDN